MGVIVTEDYTLLNGIVVESYYASINANEIRLVKRTQIYSPTLAPEPDTYELIAPFTLWISKEARETGKQSIGIEYVHVEQDTPFTDNVYDVLYSKFKNDHPNAVDA